MTRWLSGREEFPITVIRRKTQNDITIPKPIYEKLGNPKQVVFYIKDNLFCIKNAEEE